MTSVFVTELGHASGETLRERTSAGFLPPLESAAGQRSTQSSHSSLVASIEAMGNRGAANSSAENLTTALDTIPHELMITLTRHHPVSPRKDTGTVS